MHQPLRNILTDHPQFHRLVGMLFELPYDSKIVVRGLSGSSVSFLCAGLHDVLSKHVALIADHDAVERHYDDLTAVIGEDRVRLFSGGEKRDASRLSHDIGTLHALSTGADGVFVISDRALTESLPTRVASNPGIITLSRGSQRDLPQLAQELATSGFDRREFVQLAGEYALRGGILDVFPYGTETPLRAEFDGNTIISLREFDPVSQRSIQDIAAATIVTNLLEGSESGAGILSYLPQDAIVVLEDHRRIEQALATLGPVGEGVLGQLGTLRRVGITALSMGDALEFAVVNQPSFNGRIDLLRAHIAELQRQQFTIIIACDTNPELARLRELLVDGITIPDNLDALDASAHSRIDATRILFSLNSVHQGFLAPVVRWAVYTEHQIFNRLRRRRRRGRFQGRRFSLRDAGQLQRGDFVVHQDFGIGRFDGLTRINVRNAQQDVLKLTYAEGDTLYVNLSYLTRVQRYSSKEGHVPVLTRLGRGDWERLRARAKERIKDIARDLLQLYARRKHAQGYAFPPDTPWQKELEASFVYEDTFDQARATREVKQDMEAPYPMDRLVCGDVGFGKTEVAVRAAFKAVLGGKQVAVLVPTTILAVQHYNTFRERTGRYSTNVQVLTRFTPRKEQVRILTGLRSGSVDVAIGTHRLLSKDVQFKDLGLLVIDEEHRFGVAAKEKLRMLKASVDTLSLTATPIPRTLHFSLLGARDLSIIATPPRNRLPILTELVEYNEETLREAILREIGRKGQVYFVHDRVQSIEEVTTRLSRMVPPATVRYAHGRMRGRELENVMVDFLEKRFDVLVCTKIIESGLDIPNVNTIIINRADKFGMAELYQLRGRVGRSNAQAYAYLIVPPLASLSRESLMRLQAMEEFTDLGSGFNLAMRDLEIRGAGNLLGSEQSGFIESMGFEAYTRILDEAVEEVKREEFGEASSTQHPTRRRVDTIVESEFSAHISDSYIEDDAERLDLYRRLYDVETEEQLEEMAMELRDRFGPLPVETERLLQVIRLRLVSSRVGFTKIVAAATASTVEFPPKSDSQFYQSDDFQSIMSSISSMKRAGVSLAQKGEKLMLVLKNLPGDDPFARILSLLYALLGNGARNHETIPTHQSVGNRVD